MRCCVCQKDTPPRHRYCDRCRYHLRIERELVKRRNALKEAYDRDLDAFTCHWCGVVLEERDMADPFHLCFDHITPLRSARLVVSSELLNSMKTELGPKEFPLAVRELAAHRNGRPFDRDFIKFEFWGLTVPHPPPDGWPAGQAVDPTRICPVCGEAPLRRSKYCPRCYRFVTGRHRDREPRAKALREAWSAGEDGFVCQYTGVRLDERGPRSPWFLTFDHRVPGRSESIAVVAFWVNRMKAALSETEFWKVIGEYDRYLRKGGEFDRNVVGFDYWRKARRGRGARRAEASTTIQKVRDR